MSKFIFIYLSFLSLTSFSQIHQGLAEKLPLTFVKDHSFRTFENFRSRPQSPLAARVVFDGTPLIHRSEILKVFSEIVAVHLPEGKKIVETKDSEGRKIWSYPIGTILIHEVKFKDDLQSPFELRILKRLKTHWAYGMYFPTPSHYQLQKHTRRIPKKYLLAFSGKEKTVELEHLQTHTCQACHFNTTAARYQYTSMSDAGPCELTPNNPATKEWRHKYKNDPVEIKW